MENGTRMDILPNFHIHIKYQLKLGGEGSLKISDFQTKDVINIVDGKKLGQISDLELDLRNGRIERLSFRTRRVSSDCSGARRTLLSHGAIL